MEQLTSTQLSEWEAYDRLDPIGEWRSDFRMAKLASIITNIVGAIYKEEYKDPIITTPSEYMPIWDKEELKKKIVEENNRKKQLQSVEDMKEFLISFAKRHNERVEKRKNNSQPSLKRTK